MKTARFLVFAAALAGGSALAADAIEVQSGGVGLGAREALMKTYGDYNLHVAFAEISGAFLADVDVTIRDAQDRVVWSGTADGPLLFVRLPDGRYTVEAQVNRETRRRIVQVGERPGVMTYVHWDLADVPERFAAR